MTYNEEMKQALEQKYGKDLFEIFRAHTRDFIGVFKCNSCPRFVTPAALKFYHFDLNKVKCYTCQGVASVFDPAPDRSGGLRLGQKPLGAAS